MSEPVVNLARRRFVNSRPVLRTTLLLWVLGLVLAAGNVLLYRSYFVGSNEKVRRLTEVEAAIVEENAAISRLANELAAFDLGQQNQTAEFLNRKIAERAFSWSLLFDHLAEVLPRDVRLLTLSPDNRAERRSRAVERAAGDGAAPVQLKIAGEAKTDEALLAFVDALFAHPSFSNPNPQREVRQDGSLLRFDLTVLYLPVASDPGADPTVEEGLAGDETAEDASEGEDASAGEDDGGRR